MSEPRIASNVYYLPVPAVAVSLSSAPPAPSWRTVLAHTFWRLRFAAAEIRHAFRVPVPVLASEVSPFVVQRLDAATRQAPRPSAPARVIDFSAARLRRRPG
jgi:hypothetical protein